MRFNYLFSQKKILMDYKYSWGNAILMQLMLWDTSFLLISTSPGILYWPLLWFPNADNLCASKIILSHFTFSNLNFLLFFFFFSSDALCLFFGIFPFSNLFFFLFPPSLPPKCYCWSLPPSFTCGTLRFSRSSSLAKCFLRLKPNVKFL